MDRIIKLCLVRVNRHPTCLIAPLLWWNHLDADLQDAHIGMQAHILLDQSRLHKLNTQRPSDETFGYAQGSLGLLLANAILLAGSN